MAFGHSVVPVKSQPRHDCVPVLLKTKGELSNWGRNLRLGSCLHPRFQAMSLPFSQYDNKSSSDLLRCPDFCAVRQDGIFERQFLF